MVAAVFSRDTAPLPAPSVNSLANRLVPDFSAPASPLQSAVPRPLTTADSKELTENLSRLDSPVAKNRGRGVPHFVTTLELPPSLVSFISSRIRGLRTLCTNQPAARRRISCSFFTLRTLAKMMGGGASCSYSSSLATGFKQLRQPILPQHCPGVRAVPVRLIALGNQLELSIFQ